MLRRRKRAMTIEGPWRRLPAVFCVRMPPAVPDALLLRIPANLFAPCVLKIFGALQKPFGKTIPWVPAVPGFVPMTECVRRNAAAAVLTVPYRLEDSRDF